MSGGKHVVVTEPVVLGAEAPVVRWLMDTLLGLGFEAPGYADTILQAAAVIAVYRELHHGERAGDRAAAFERVLNANALGNTPPAGSA